MILFIDRIVLFLRGSDSLELDQNVGDGVVLLHLEHRDPVHPPAVYCIEHHVIFRRWSNIMFGCGENAGKDKEN